METNLIQCKECGNWYKSLNTHIRTHDMTVKEYKDKHGYLYTESLEIDSTSKLRSESAKELVELGIFKPRKKGHIPSNKGKKSPHHFSIKGLEKMKTNQRERLKNPEYKAIALKNLEKGQNRGEDLQKKSDFLALITEFKESKYTMISKFLKEKNILSNSFYVYAKRHNIIVKELI